MSDLSPEELDALRERIKGGMPEKGNEAECRVSSILTVNGISSSMMPVSHSFDIKTAAGLRVEVKAAYTKIKATRGQKCDIYKFRVRKHLKGEYCDVFLCFIVEFDACFIIPSSEIGDVEFIYISWPQPDHSRSKWHQYHDRFDLLQKKRKDD